MQGLTSEEVRQRTEEGKVNYNDNPNTRTYKQIILSNTLTFFNFLNIVLFVLVILVGSYKNSLFVLIIVYNSIIGIVQEIRAKKILDDLSIMTQSKTVVLRDGKKWSLATDKLVLDDVIYLKTGDQVPADCKILEGELEANESLLTGEADNLPKKVGDELYSGSFVTAGTAACRIIHVGSDNYASRITQEAKEFKKHHSELRNSLNAILKVIAILIIPIGAALFYKQYYIVGDSLKTAVVSTTSAVVGMIPEGLVLLTSVTLTIGAVKLAMRKTLVQELYCIETLARVDTLCLDKTGTITEGTMKVETVIPYSYEEDPYDGSVMAGEDLNTTAGPESDEGFGGDERTVFGALPDKLSEIQDVAFEDLEQIMGNLMEVLPDQNATAEALKERFKGRNDLEAVNIIPFSSDRKYSGAAFLGKGTFLIGAVQFLFPEGFTDLRRRTEQYAKEGLRVLVLAGSPEIREDTGLPNNLRPLGLILLTDVIREEAPKTLAYFGTQGVDLKVISGDDPVTVAAIAKRAGLPGADRYVDATTIHTPEEMKEAVAAYSVFGRVTPQQKKEMVIALKEQGRTVAMTGDGVNDVLALKEADCSIAMAEGSDAAKNTANVVLLDSNFASMPHIVNQGRRVINNIQTAASMFLIKTIFSFMLALVTIFFGRLYPFEPIQMSLISSCAVGTPTFFLSQENNYNRIGKSFLRQVFANAFPAAITITGCVFTIMLVCQNVFHSTVMLNTACFLVTGWNYMAALKNVYAPLNTYRKAIIYSMQVFFFAAAVIGQSILGLKSLEFGMIILVFLLMTFAPIFGEFLTNLIHRFYEGSLNGDSKKLFQRIIDKLMD